MGKEHTAGELLNKHYNLLRNQLSGYKKHNKHNNKIQNRVKKNKLNANICIA